MNFMDNYLISVALTSLSLLALLFSVIAFILAINATIEVRALKNSTHTVTFQPIDPKIDKENEEYMSKWGTKQEELDKQHKLFKEELEESMPEFAPDDEDLKVHSF